MALSGHLVDHNIRKLRTQLRTSPLVPSTALLDLYFCYTDGRTLILELRTRAKYLAEVAETLQAPY